MAFLKEGGLIHDPFKAHTDCVHCGICLSVCPTYLELGNEADSPRGRIYLMLAAQEGRIQMDESYERHIYLCLGCRHCETACPSGVEFSALMDVARSQLEKKARRPLGARILRALLLRGLFTRPSLLRLAFQLTRLYQISGLQRLVRKTRILRLLPWNLESLERLLPEVRSASEPVKLGSAFSAKGERRYRVAFLVGCVMNQLLAHIHRACIRVLNENGCEVIVPEGQLCCGAILNHAGEREAAQKLARKNIAAFEKYDCDAIVVNAAGCGALLKEYSRLLSDDQLWRDRALAFCRKVKDISEFLAEIPVRAPSGQIRRRVAYDDPCHLIHAQHISRAPRDLLKKIPGLQLVPLANSESCCGSAGIYNITHHEMSLRILKRKIDDIVASGAEILATGNPGCIMQIAYGLRLRGLSIEVVHPVELLDRSYQNEDKR